MQSLAVVFVLTSSLLGQTVGAKEAPVTVVEGESWLNHIHRSFDETSMGKTGRLGPPASAPEDELLHFQLESSPDPDSQTETLRGSDLYRLNCRGCHGESGLGAPPEINSVLDPVRASSVVSVKERMQRAGMDISRAEAGKLAEEARSALLQRLHNGGEDMPPFRHLNGEEVRSLVAYLKQLAGISGARSGQVAIKESPLRVGEHIAKSTCHICHDASGANPSALQLSEGAIPPLNTLTSRLSRLEFIRKVTRGAPVVMGAPPLPYRGRMPVFYYLSEGEADDVYLYLTSYPSYQWATLDSVNPELAENRPAADAAPPQKGSMLLDAKPSNARRPDETPDKQIRASIVAGLSVALLLAIVFGFTVRELMRLSAAAEVHHSGPCNIEIEQAGDVADAKSESRLIA